MARFVRPTNMRKTFLYPHKEATHYFPGHMAKGMNQMQRKLKNVDCILEVHDARIPLSGRNPNFGDALIARPHILLLNKVDLADIRHKEDLFNIYKQQRCSNVMYTNCIGPTTKLVSKQLLPMVIETIESSPRFNRTQAEDYNILVIGVPNVGKSSLINLLREANLGKSGKATAVGPVAGVTRSVLEKIKISDIPRVYIYDSPGILHPNITDMEEAMNLALCATLKDSLVGEDTIVDYMLYKLNMYENFRYVNYYKLPQSTDNIWEFLAFIAKGRNLTIKKKNSIGNFVVYPDFHKAAQLVLKDFRNGLLGKINLDQGKIEQMIEDT